MDTKQAANFLKQQDFFFFNSKESEEFGFHTKLSNCRKLSVHTNSFPAHDFASTSSNAKVSFVSPHVTINFGIITVSPQLPPTPSRRNESFTLWCYFCDGVR